MTIKALIVDDEFPARTVVRRLLEENCPQVIVVGEAESGDECLSLLEANDVNLLFLDIEMPNMNGFELLAKIDPQKRQNLSVVFTTAYDEYAIRAFEIAAIDYILKPITANVILRSIARINSNSERMLNQQLEIISASLDAPKKSPERMAFPTSTGLTIVLREDLIRCESERNYTLIHCRDKKPLLLSKNLKLVEEIVGAGGFLRVHHSHLINLAYVSNYIRGEGGILEMNDGTQIPVSRSKKAELLNQLSA